MYPFIRYTSTIIKSAIRAKKGNTLTFRDTGEIEFYCRLTDIDNFLEMNNGRVLTLYDMGRTDFAVRSGLGRQLLKQRWGMVVAGSTVQYRKRIRAFDKVTMKTHIAGFDERWIYIEQSMWVKGKPCSSALLRTGITESGKVIETARVLEALDQADWQLPPTGYVAEWIVSDADRPWPPQS
ncbi:acyl-CoA thioesterase [Psychrobacter sp. APC 3426]|uniref:acyl-CoA thioesterase n=1 Tax=Psychrobacter sp. APC 3426 TaxID=3035177 RepID=UPI0025B2AD14|nr:acyl-CoA thioesterase [Psychrobacter sp. APC 3426]MDN3397760.1 acyl-CoA thioesterase [Psychrobacter sp. APC 3426]